MSGAPRTEEGDEARVEVRAVAAGGAGVADLPDGRVVFVHGTAPGDRARVRVDVSKGSWARAILLEVLEPGEGRRAPPCPHYGRCGGCTLEHLRYREQLRWKGRLVADALERIGGMEDVEPPAVTPSPLEFRYRNRVSFHLRRLAGGRVVAGFHERDRPGRIADVDGRCLLPEEPVALVWEGLRSAWGERAERLPGGRALRLTLRAVDDGVLLLAEPEGRRRGRGERGERGMGDAEALVSEVRGLVSVWWRDHGSAEAVHLAGDPDPVETWGGRVIRPGPGAFLQVNREAAELLEAAVLREVGAPAGRRIVDAYCGVGVYGRRLAHHGGTVTGVELDPRAVEAARDGAPDGYDVLEGRVEDVLADALPADAVVLNPPRTGLDAAVPELLAERGPGRIVYVSCDPATLARDVERLGRDYRVVRLQAFDLFPQTAHVETVATLERVGSSTGPAPEILA